MRHLKAWLHSLCCHVGPTWQLGAWLTLGKRLTSTTVSSMPGTEGEPTPTMSDTNHFDVLIVGAGLSGIGAAYHLQQECPDHTFTILEGRDDIGGTWDLFRYPGVRSDSDMHTLGFSFKPWTAEKSIASGSAILEYLRETVAEFAIREHIRFGHLAQSADWDSTTSTWTITCQRTDGGDAVTVTANFLYMCSGYYSYKGGHTPEFAESETFAGTVVHPQQWPEDLDYTNKRVVIIGSGATAVTLLPAIADTASHVTMLQRSPTYMAAAPDVDPINKFLRRVLPSRTAYAITRKKNVAIGQFFYQQTRKHPAKIKTKMLDMVRKKLPADYDIEQHFTPDYNPWDQRVCLVPNGDLFASISSGKASVVTDEIVRFTETGIELRSGEHIDADIIVTATGLTLVTLGEIDFTVDGKRLNFAQTWTYKGIAYSGVPNLVSSFGYVNASWTLRSDLISHYVCRLLQHMAATQNTKCVPLLRDEDQGMSVRPYIDDFSSGYMQRAMPLLPKQGDHSPWTNPQAIAPDKAQLEKSVINDGAMQFY